MNINQIGQKKKKQAVRRLSQSSPAVQGSRKEDIRRKLEAKRLANSQDGRGGRQKPQRGNLERGRSRMSDRKFESSKSGPFIRKNLGPSQSEVRRHISPLVRTNTQGETVIASSEMPPTTSVFLSRKTAESSNNIERGTSKQGNVFKSSLFKKNIQQGNVFGGSHVETEKKENAPAASQHGPVNVFGAFSSSKPKEGQQIVPQTSSRSDGIFGSKNCPANSTIRAHPSPLAGNLSNTQVTNKSQNIFGTRATESEKIFQGSNSEKSPGNVFVGVYQPESQSTGQSSSASIKAMLAMSNSQAGHQNPFSGTEKASNDPENVLKMGIAMKSHEKGNVKQLAVKFEQNVNQSSSTKFLAAIRSSGNTLEARMATSHTPFGVSASQETTNHTQQNNFSASAQANSAFANGGTPQSSNVFSSTTHSTSSSNSGSAFGSPTSNSVFGSAGVPTVSTTSLSQNFNNSRTIFGGSTMLGGIFGSAALPPSLPTSTTSLSQSSSTTFNSSAIQDTATLTSNSPTLSNTPSNSVIPFTNPSRQYGVFGNTAIPISSTGISSTSGNSGIPFGSPSVQSNGFGIATLPVNSTELFNSTTTSIPSVQNSIFGSVGLPASTAGHGKNDKAFSLNQEAHTSAFSAERVAQNSGNFDASPMKGSIFGTAGLSPSSAGFQKSSGIFSVNQNTSGAFNASNDTTSPSGASTFSSKTNIFGSTGLPSPSDKLSSVSTIGPTSAGPFGNVVAKNRGIFQSTFVGGKTASQSVPGLGKFPSSLVSSKETSEMSQVQTGRRLSSEKPKGTIAQRLHNNQLLKQWKTKDADCLQRLGCSAYFAAWKLLHGKLFLFKSYTFSMVISPKGLKRSLSSSNVDVSELTAIVVKGLTREYFNKEVLVDCFSKFGQVKKVSLQPTKENAVVTFVKHESAKKAKSKALELFPVKNLGVYWCKRTRSNSGTSASAAKPMGQAAPGALNEANEQELSFRKLSISNVLQSIDVNALPLAVTAQDRFTLLDEIDKKIRQAVKPHTDITTAPTVVGVCPDMCPEKERYMREARANLSIFEMVPGTQDNRDGDVPRVDHNWAVKEYSRSAADKLEPLAHELRPVHVLQTTLDYLASKVMDSGEGRWGEWFNFLWNRTRAIRKDITQQHLCNVRSVDLVEKITRFHIFCAHYLCEEDMHSFDPKINNENLTKCLQTLKQFYVDLHNDQNIICPREPEFQAYDILLNLNEGDTLRKAMQYRLEVRNSPEVKFALAVFSSLNSNNFVRFFKLLKSASYLNACLMHRYFTQVRSQALLIMTKAYRSQEPYPLQGLMELLAFEDKQEAMQFCIHYNLTTSEDFVQFSKSSYVDPETVFPLQRATNVIESKRNCSIGEVVCVSPAKAVPYHEPLCSFDSHGRYIGLSNLAQLLGSAADHVEPESPDIYYEPADSVPSEKRSSEVAQSVRSVDDDDLRQILAQEIQNTCNKLMEEAVDGLVKDISQDVLREVNLKLDLSKTFVDNFIDKSLNDFVRDIVRQCVNEETMARRERIAVAESKARVSASVLREMLNEVIKSKLVAVAKQTRREIEQRLRAESFMKMSAVIMREITEEAVSKECHDIAFRSRKDVVEQKKASLWLLAKSLFKSRRERYFNRWCKEYRHRVHIRNILLQIPALPPMLTTKQQVQKLFNHKDMDICSSSLGELPQLWSFSSRTSSGSIILPKLLADTNNLPSIMQVKSGLGSVQQVVMIEGVQSLFKYRKELQEHLEEVVKQQELKRARAKEPIDIPELLSDVFVGNSTSTQTRQPTKNTLSKLIISLPEGDKDNSSVTVQELIKCKFRRGRAGQSPSIPAALRDKVETLSCYSSKIRILSKTTLDFKIDIKACSGVLSNEESQLVQDGHLFRGSTGIFFLLDSCGRVKDDMFWTSSRTRLRRILRSKPSIPGIPLVILNISDHASGDSSIFEEQLNINSLRQEGFVSQWTIYQQQGPVDSDNLHQQLAEVIRWLVNHYPSLPTIQCENIKSFVENEILQHFTIPLHEEIALRKKALLQPQCPEVIIELYNAVIEHAISVITNAALKEISWPVPEFITSLEDLPPVSWNSSEHLDRLHIILENMRLPSAPSPAQDGKWKSECLLCLDYVNGLVLVEPLKVFGFSLVSSVKKILNECAVNKSSHASVALTAADVPWPQVVEACVGSMLSWFHSLQYLGNKNVYYLEEHLRSFTEPVLWRAAIMESLKLVKTSMETRKKNKSSPKLCNLSAEVERELSRLTTSCSFSRSSISVELKERDDFELSSRLLDEKLETEKRKCERFEKHLKSLLDEEPDLDLSELGQGLKRKYDPSWSSDCKPEKTFIKKVSEDRADEISLPDLTSTISCVETSLMTFQNQLALQKRAQEFSEAQLKKALEFSP